MGRAATTGQFILLIHVPKSVTIDLETRNGPLSLYDVNGKADSRAQNGPIT